MPHPLYVNIQDRLTTLHSRLMRLIEPRLLTRRLYATAPSERAALPLPTLSRKTAIDSYYAGRFFLTVLSELAGQGVIVSGGHSAFSLTTLLSPFPEGKDALNHLTLSSMTAPDLARLPDGSCSYLLLSHTLNEVADPRTFLREVKRVLTSDGTLAATLSSIAPPIADETSLLGFSPAAAQYLFQEIFPDRTLTVTSYGNVLAGRALLTGVSANTVPQAKLDFVDPYFPILTGVLVK